MRRWAILGAVFLSACGSARQPPPIDVRAIGAVVGRIKEEIGTYQRIVQDDRRSAASRSPLAPGVVCGNGSVDFDIVRATATLTTTVRYAANASGGASIPLLPAGVPGTVAPSVTGGRTTTNTQVLTFNAYPNLPTEYAGSLALTERPVAAILLSLRAALREAARTQPCLSTVHDPATDKENVVEVAFEVEEVAGVGIKLNLVVVDLGASGERRTTVGNSIVIGFRPYVPASEPARARAPRGRRPIPEAPAAAPSPETVAPGRPAGGDGNPNSSFRFRPVI